MFNERESFIFHKTLKDMRNKIEFAKELKVGDEVITYIYKFGMYNCLKLDKVEFVDDNIIKLENSHYIYDRNGIHKELVEPKYIYEATDYLRSMIGKY